MDIRVIGTLFAIIDKYNKIDYISLLKLFDLENSINENSGLLEQKALNVLHEYEGANNYILKLKGIFNPNKRGIPTRSQCEYILNYSNTTPKVAKKWVILDTYFAQKLADDKLYTEIPQKVWVEKLLADKEKAYHIWGKVFENEELHDFWLPKAAVIKDNTVKDVVINYEKYSNRWWRRLHWHKTLQSSRCPICWPAPKPSQAR